jgi:hypothetical protein
MIVAHSALQIVSLQGRGMIQFLVMKSWPWQKIGTIGIFTLGFLVILIAVLGRSEHSQISAKPANPWNAHAVEGVYAGVRVREIDASKAAVVFLYDIDNKTDTDYQLAKGDSVVVMSRIKSSRSLTSERPVALSTSAFVPARNRTRIALEIAEPFSWPTRPDASSENRFRQLVAREVADLDGFVLFDQAHRYQVDLPGSWPAIEIAPDRSSHR